MPPNLDGVGNKWGSPARVLNPPQKQPEMLLEQHTGCKATVTEVFLASKHPGTGVSGCCSSREGPRCHQAPSFTSPSCSSPSPPSHPLAGL